MKWRFLDSVLFPLLKDTPSGVGAAQNFFSSLPEKFQLKGITKFLCSPLPPPVQDGENAFLLHHLAMELGRPKRFLKLHMLTLTYHDESFCS